MVNHMSIRGTGKFLYQFIHYNSCEVMCRVVEKQYVATPDAKQNKFIYSYARTSTHMHTNNNYTPIAQYIDKNAASNFLRK